ncbi:hypothetical protein ACVWXO_004801 [Bradyrhizobium sp. LM2.7]
MSSAPDCARARELTAVTDIKIGKWYDPISEQWIVPRETSPETSSAQSTEERLLDIHKRDQAERIWHLLVDCCARE